MYANRIRALYVQPAVAFGGAERQAATNVPLLAEFGVDVLPLVGPGTDILEWFHERGFHEVVHCPEFPPNWRPTGAAMRAALPLRYVHRWALVAREIERLMCERRFQVVFASLAFGWIAATPVARRFNLPVLWRAGGTEITPMQRRLLSATLRMWSPDRFVCCSEAVQAAYTGLIAAPMTVVPNGVDSDQFTPEAGSRSRYRPDGARVVVGFAARLAAQKRPRDFVALAASLARRHPEVAFLAAGDGPERAECESLAHALGARNLHFLGYVEDMRSFYRACDIFVLPSRSEGAPNVVLEAMAMRRAVVASDVPGTREIIRDRVDGLIVPIGDLPRLEHEVVRLIEDRALRDQLAGRGLDSVRRRFSARASARRTAELMHALTAARWTHAFPARAEPPPPPGSPTRWIGTAPAAAPAARTGRPHTPGGDRRGTGETRSGTRPARPWPGWDSAGS
jgi:glycosyltransferase involved in cell wall biosynthesis